MEMRPYLGNNDRNTLGLITSHITRFSKGVSDRQEKGVSDLNTGNIDRKTTEIYTLAIFDVITSLGV